MILRVIVYLLGVSLILAAQDESGRPQPGTPAASIDSAPTAGPQSPGWKGLTVKEKLRYDWRHLFDPENIVFAGIGAGLDQWRDRPGQWGQGWGPYFGRYGSHLAQYAVQRSIMFPVQAIDHEDTRYFSSTRSSYKGRLGDAFLHTVWRHSDKGGMMPAYSEFLGDYGASAVSRMWWPSQYRNGSSIFLAGTNTLLIDAGINVYREFKPDLKRWLHIGRF